MLQCSRGFDVCSSPQPASDHGHKGVPIGAAGLPNSFVRAFHPDTASATKKHGPDCILPESKAGDGLLPMAACRGPVPQ